jgi:GWxTD domain-containing protein
VATTPYIKMTACFLQAALVAMCIGAPARAQSSRSEQRTTGRSESSHDLSSEYQRWLDEDVRWIVTPEERAAFIRLSKNEERGRFVEAFWLRRNPTPGTPRNEYKEEHYRRIAYANVHFAQAVPGWETDRGRIYIVYGPPERIKTDLAHRSDDPEKPTQVWHYHSIPGYGKDIDLKFVDVCRCGDYRLETPLKNWLSPDI